MNNKLFPYIQRFLPKKLITRLCGFLAETKIPWIKNPLILAFAKYYRVNLNQYEHTNATSYKTFNAFFTRALQPGARKFSKEKNDVISPADGQISQLGYINHDKILQAKGKFYNLIEFLGEDSIISNRLLNGSFITVYLSPRDYHRVHMPFSGTLLQTTYIPGSLFSVNQDTTKQIPNLFAKNERVVNIFETENQHLMAIVMVGAMIVSSIENKWRGIITSTDNTIDVTKYPQHNDNLIFLKKGDEMGLFRLGSTVVALFEEKVAWDCGLKADDSVLMGQTLGGFTQAPKKNTSQSL